MLRAKTWLLFAGVELAVVAVLLLAGAVTSQAHSNNEPVFTSNPAITQSGSELTLGNGGWFSYSGSVDYYVFRFFRDGVLIKGATSVPKSEPWGSPPLAGQYPEDSTANLLPISSTDYGHVFCGDVYGGTHSAYPPYYDVIEWGHTSAADGSQEKLTCLTATAPPVNTPNVIAAQAWLNESVNSLKASYAWSHPTAASYLSVHQAADQIAKAQAFLRGENPAEVYDLGTVTMAPNAPGVLRAHP